MVRSFMERNPGWDVERYYDGDLDELLPQNLRAWLPFSRCELGRWYAMRDALRRHGTVLYSDGDVRWYAPYSAPDADAVLTPHYVTQAARRSAKHWLMKDGIANIGVVQVSATAQSDELFDFVIGETLHNPTAFMHGRQLWLQNLVSCIPAVGFDCAWNTDCGMNVACWNLRHGDRSVHGAAGACVVRTPDGDERPLVSFHFSSKSLGELPSFGPAVSELLAAYRSEP